VSGSARGGMTARRRRPHGRASSAKEDAVGTDKPAREALLEAAAALFAERGPAAVSTREIATAAGVNNGLIHRHFRTKDELLRQTLDRLSADIASAATRATESRAPSYGVEQLFEYFEAASQQSRYWRLLARCILDGKGLEALQSDYPTLRAIVDRIAELQDRGALPRELDPQALALFGTAAGLGWLLFEPFLARAAASHDGEPSQQKAAALRRAVRETVVRLLEPKA